MDHQQIETVVLTVLTTVLKCDVDGDSTRKNTPQWDSLKHIEVIFAIEDKLGLQFSEEALAGLDSVVRIVDSIFSLRNAA